MQLVSIFFKDAHFLILSKDVFPVVIFDCIANRNKRRTGQFSNTRKEWNSIQPIGSTVTLNFSTNSLPCSESRFLQMCPATSGNTHFESISKVSRSTCESGRHKLMHFEGHSGNMDRVTAHLMTFINVPFYSEKLSKSYFPQSAEIDTRVS